MARIRTVKPEFWTSEQIAECSPSTRLLFIGMWTFCDDHGIHPASLKTIKMEVFPSDDIPTDEIACMIRELESNGLIRTYTVDNKDYWLVLGWKHQKIDKPTYRHPLPEDSSKPRRQLAESSPTESSLVESNGVESKGEVNKPYTARASVNDLINNVAVRVEHVIPLTHEEQERCAMLCEYLGAKVPAFKPPMAMVERWAKRGCTVSQLADTLDYELTYRNANNLNAKQLDKTITTILMMQGVA